MDEHQHWMTRLDAFSEHLRNERQVGLSTQSQYASIVRRWIDFAIPCGHDPAAYDQDLVDEFLDSQRNLSAGSRGSYSSNLEVWCRWAAQELPDITRFDTEVAHPIKVSNSGDQLAELVAEWRAEYGYPMVEDHKNKEIRQKHELVLKSLTQKSDQNRDELKRVWSTKDPNYGWSGPQVHLNKTVNAASEESWLEICESLTQLCFGDDAFEDRIDRAIHDVHGLGPAGATRLLAICHPQHFIPIYVLRKSTSENYSGTLDFVELLDKLELLDEAGSQEASNIGQMYDENGQDGAVIVRSNKLFVNLLGPYIADTSGIDAWGIAMFLYWLDEQYDEAKEPWVSEEKIAELADELLFDRNYVSDIVELLEDKGQVILYGPPGTGKTYFADRLAYKLSMVQDDDEYGEHWPYSVVQFHPAYSYEDFFEGFRPAIDDEGQMTYVLTPGPLVRLAKRAGEHPDELHVMVIDEINRANLPRVLGELLYLLEYRGEEIQTQYRPEEWFSLPSNLWFIGTMNTADRSIAMIDAAMRRRFHFVPFFPDREPTSGLLRRWCERHEPEQAWVADLLDAVNERLRGDLGGDYMLIGPSYFMQSGLDYDGLRRIWRYNIEPLIEDQFFGKQDVISGYRFDAVWRRHGPEAARREEAEPPAEADTGTGNEASA